MKKESRRYGCIGSRCEDNSFDLIFNPVSNCYIEDISLMWKECARIIRKGGVLKSANMLK